MDTRLIVEGEGGGGGGRNRSNMSNFIVFGDSKAVVCEDLERLL